MKQTWSFGSQLNVVTAALAPHNWMLSSAHLFPGDRKGYHWKGLPHIVWSGPRSHDEVYICLLSVLDVGSFTLSHSSTHNTVRYRWEQLLRAEKAVEHDIAIQFAAFFCELWVCRIWWEADMETASQRTSQSSPHEMKELLNYLRDCTSCSHLHDEEFSEFYAF